MSSKFKTFFLRPGRRSFAYLAASLPLLLIAIAGLQYGAFPLYAAPAVICLVQLFRPTMVGWLLIFIPYFVMSAAWVFGLARDLVRISTNQNPGILLDLDDSIVFLGLLVISLGLCFWLWRVRPKFETGA
jgi:hypothetical protein